MNSMSATSTPITVGWIARIGKLCRHRAIH
jgi:hypothetical protein